MALLKCVSNFRACLKCFRVMFQMEAAVQYVKMALFVCFYTLQNEHFLFESETFKATPLLCNFVVGVTVTAWC